MRSLPQRAAGAHLHDQLARPRDRVGALLDRDPAAAVVDRRAHRHSLRAAAPATSARASRSATRATRSPRYRAASSSASRASALLACRVAAGREHALVGVARGHDDRPPVEHGGVQRHQRVSWPPCGPLGHGEARCDLVRELALLPQPAGLVQELLELGGDAAEAGRAAEDERVGPLEVTEAPGRLAADLLLVGGPLLVARDRLLGRELLDVPAADLGAGGRAPPRPRASRSTCPVALS